MNRYKFTLVELLVVVGLISLLLGLVAPAFSRMMSGNKVADATGNLKLGLEQAQSYAVSRRTYVALILPNASSANTDDDGELSAMFGGFRVAEVSIDRNSSVITFKQWVDDFPWKARGEGGVLIYNSTVDTGATGSSVVKDGVFKKTISEETKKVKFEGLLNVEGLIMQDGTAPVTRENCAIIFSPYGGCYCGTSYYFVVAEGKVNEDRLELAGEKGEIINFLTLKVNGYTGRVEYYDGNI